MTAQLKLFLFDIDGTLIYTGGAGTRAMIQAFREIFNIKEPFKNYFLPGRTDLMIVREIVLNHTGTTPSKSEISHFFKTYIKNLKQEMENTNYTVLKGVLKTVTELSKRHDSIVGLGTGNIKEGARIKLEKGDLWKLFPFGGFGDDAYSREDMLKAGVKKAKAMYNLNSDFEVFVVGDSRNDIIAAKKAGFVSIAVATGWEPAEKLKEYEPDFLISAIDEILDLKP